MKTNAAFQPSETPSRRLYDRRSSETDVCVGQVQNDMYPVEDWSQGGVLLSGDNKFFDAEKVYDVTLRFKLRDRVLNVSHPARVVRKYGDKTAMQFTPLTKEVRSAFQKVIDDMVASGFANSQAE